MKQAISIALCAGVLTLVCPSLMRAQAELNSNAQIAANDDNSAQAMHEASQMVPANATLLSDVDAKKNHQGDEIRAELGSTIQLKNGRELPKGTVLVGTVTQDDTQPRNVMLAMRFNEATLKDGSNMPVKAMLLSVQPVQGAYEPGEDMVRTPASDLWTSETIREDQIGSVSGADLHSNITSDNSGVISSNKKNDVKLEKGSVLDLAIASGDTTASNR